MRRVGMLLKHGKPEAAEIAAQLTPWLSSQGHEVVVSAGDGEVPGTRSVPPDALADAIDLLVILGGDGTLLHGASLVADRGIPILGVNLGHLGFLTSCAPADAQTAITRALSGQMPLEERMRLRCELHRAEGETIVKFACN